mmetsp:Transcript_34192/g.52463  ORF Transcript_34192/g.52463 Transcript_34192/m.52463 type:complete len:94 (+) Transcript_34192:984-1265(+)
MHAGLKLKDQQVALAASEFWSGIIQTKNDDKVDSIYDEKIQNNMERILAALLECCVMADADRMGDLPTREADVAHVEAKTVDDNEDEDDDSEN